MGEADERRAAGEESAVELASPLAYEQARLAYSIIETLLEHTRATSDLIALMAQALDEDVTKAVTETPHWAAYLESRRAMERTRADIERFAEEWTRMQTPEPAEGAGETPAGAGGAPTSVGGAAPGSEE